MSGSGSKRSLNMIDIEQVIAKNLNIPQKSVSSTIALLDAGNTISFIARYRKEMTGELDEVKIRDIEELLKHYRTLEQRKADVIRLIDEQGKLTDDLRSQIAKATKMVEVEDIYQPFKLKRKTRASIAREKGLEPLAQYLLSYPMSGSVNQEAEKYLTDTVLSAEDALQGASDIIAESVSDTADIRSWVRKHTKSNGMLCVKAKDAKKDSVYRMYYDYRELVAKIPPHRILAINRGEKEEFLNVSIEIGHDPIIDWMHRKVIKNEHSIVVDLVRSAILDAYKRLLATSIERDIRSELTDKAEKQAIIIFSKNLRSLLLQPPIKGRVVLGVDPAYRTGCKWAVVDGTGKMLEVGVVYPTPPQNKTEESERIFENLIGKYEIDCIVIGNGTGSRETEQFVANLIRKLNSPKLSYAIVSEAGASVYSASKLAAKEFPELEVEKRSAVSISRRLIDPLAELVKIDPKAIGVGQYQHDITPKRLEESLTQVVESSVNYVGVDLNTASPSLLKYVSGVNASVAENIVQYREQYGRFKNRHELAKVPRLGAKAYEQCAGFLRINNGDNPLDATPIHPESYELTDQLLKLAGLEIDEIRTQEFRRKLIALDIKQIAGKLSAGVPTIRDIAEALLRPGRDPRDDLPQPIFRKDVLSIEDLQPGMQLKGVVRNVVDFGVFVDIGVKNDGFIHISQLSERYIKHPMDVVSIGDIVTVSVISVDIERKKIALTAKDQSGHG
jgi:uncharacterized protein